MTGERATLFSFSHSHTFKLSVHSLTRLGCSDLLSLLSVRLSLRTNDVHPTIFRARSTSRSPGQAVQLALRDHGPHATVRVSRYFSHLDASTTRERRGRAKRP